MHLVTKYEVIENKIDFYTSKAFDMISFIPDILGNEPIMNYELKF